MNSHYSSKIFIVLLASFFLLPTLASANYTITSTASANAGQGFGYDTSNSQYLGQSFVTIGAGTVSSITTPIFHVGSPSDAATVSIYSDSATSPNAELAISASNDGTSCSDVTFSFASPVTLAAATTYWVVYKRTGALNTGNFYGTCGDDITTYGIEKSFQGGLWVLDPQGARVVIPVDDIVVASSPPSIVGLVRAFWIR